MEAFLLFTKILDGSPVSVGNTKPFTIAGPDINVDGTEVVVLLMARCAASGDLHVQLDRVHTQDDVTDMRQHVTGRYDTAEGGEFHQLLHLWAPLLLVGQVNIGAEFDCLQTVSTSAFFDTKSAVGSTDRVFRIRVRV